MNFSAARIWFFISIVVLSFAYGAAVGKWKWFPHSFLDRAAGQARTVLGTSYESNEWSRLVTDRVYEREGMGTVKPEEKQPGMTLVTSSWMGSDDWKVGLRLIGEEGKIMHEWLVRRQDLFPKSIISRRNPQRSELHGSHLLPNGDVLVNVEYLGLVRMNACGDILWRLEEGNHHSIARADDGSFWVPAVSREPRAGSEGRPTAFPGLRKNLWLDRILNVSKEGTVRRDLNVLNLLYENDLERLLFKAFRPLREVGIARGNGVDVTHLNDVEPLSQSMADQYPLFEAGDLLVSLRYPNLIFVVDPDSRDVKWHVTGPFIQQHDPDFIGDGWIGIFDNNRDYSGRGEVLGGSRIVALEPHTDSVQVRFPTQHSDPFYTAFQGKWQQLGNGNMLLTEAKAGRVVEVADDGATVWEWIHAPHGSDKVPKVAGASRHNLTRKEVASWPCSSVDSVSTSNQSN